MKKLILLLLIMGTAIISGCAYFENPWGPYPFFNTDKTKSDKSLGFLDWYQYDSQKESVNYVEEYDN